MVHDYREREIGQRCQCSLLHLVGATQIKGILSYLIYFWGVGVVGERRSTSILYELIWSGGNRSYVDDAYLPRAGSIEDIHTGFIHFWSEGRKTPPQASVSGMDDRRERKTEMNEKETRYRV